VVKDRHRCAWAIGCPGGLGQRGHVESRAAGEQHYTRTQAVKNGVLTGTAMNDKDQTTHITEGWVNGSRVWFVERISVQGGDLVITYTGSSQPLR
jgi:hypothetical protein